MNLYNAWIYTMQSILTSTDACHVEDYFELRNYKIEFTAEACSEILTNTRVMNDFEEMKKVFFTEETNVFGHSYHNAVIGPKLGRQSAVDDIVSVLSKNGTTRKAVLTFVPYGDEKVPCINVIHFMLRDGMLEITYFSRGQDVFRKFPCDAMCIVEYGNQVAKRMDLKIAKISAVITSAHIYEKDMEAAKELIERCYKKKIIYTGNRKKYCGFEELLTANEVELMVSRLEIPEIQSVEAADVIKNKAKFLYEKLGVSVWVDDVSLVLKEYPLFPGTYTKSIFKQIGIGGLEALLEGKSKEATIICRMCAYDGKKYSMVEGENRGYFDFSKDIEDMSMPLNSIFVGEGKMVHREKAIMKLIEWENNVATKE